MTLRQLYLSPRGRINRQPYWLYSVPLAILSLLPLAVQGETTPPWFAVLFLPLSLVVLWAAQMLNIKRLHDLNRSGWWLLLLLVPYAGAIAALIYLGFTPGTASENHYGADPLAGVDLGPREADLQWLRERAESGDPVAQYNLGQRYRRGRGVPQDDAQAAVWYRKAADQGDARAQYNFGAAYADGRGVPQDDAQAAVWFRNAANQGHARAQYHLGVSYAEGDGVPQDDAQAVVWYRKAADQGHAIAQNNLGVLYANGRGVPQDDAQAVVWYRKAADQGDASAQYNLGVRYAEGRGVPQDDAQAVAWFRNAADQGDADAQSFLGALYADGRGVPQDDVEAHMWINLAASRVSGADQTKVANARDTLAKRMSLEQIAEAQQRAREWKPTVEQ